MAGGGFSLQPFPDSGPPPAYRLTGEAQRLGDILRFAWVLSGALAGLEIPPATASPERRDKLWQATCFEFFLALPGATGYWEANLSPAGHWQLYRFDDYRQGMQPEPKITTLAIDSTQTSTFFRLTATIGLANLLPSDQPLQLGVSAVLRALGGATSYWALAHPGEKPDFHQRGGFLLAI